jgi:transposase
VTAVNEQERLNWAYVGVDIHKASHTAVILSPFGDRLGSRTLPNHPEAFPTFLQAVRALAGPRRLRFGLENASTWGRALAEYLVAAGESVHLVAPVRTDRSRRHHPHPDKTDDRDAQAIGRALLQDLAELPEVRPDERHFTLSLALTNREGLVRERTRVKNRLHQLLPYAHPAYAEYFGDPFGKTALAFWERYPSPDCLSGVTIPELGAFLRAESNYYHGRPKAAAILELAAKSPAGGEFQAERDALVRATIQQLRQLEAGIHAAEEQLARLVAGFGQHLQTIPGVDVVGAAELLAGIGDVHRFATSDKLARYAGIAPKEWSSAGKGKRTRSAHGERQLHRTFFRLAVVQISRSRKGEPLCPESRAYFEKKLREGKSKKAALTCLMRVLVRVVWRMLRERAPYEKKVQAGKR